MAANFDKMETGRWAELLQPQYAFATTTLCLGVGLFAFNVFFVATALPSAIIELHGAALISWAFSLYLILAIASGSAASLCKQRFGGQRVFLVSVALFIAGTLLAGFATSMPQLLCGRAIQGLSAGLIEALCYALIPELFPSRLVPKVFGVEAVMWASAAFAGPVLAGYVTEIWSWRIAFLISIPVALLFAVLIPIVVPKTPGTPSTARFPGLRLFAIATGMLLVTFSSIAAGNHAAILLVFALGLIALAIVLDHKAQERLLPREAFGFSTPMGIGFWVAMLMPLAQSSGSVFLVYGVQHVFGHSPAAAGSINALLAVSWSLSQILLSTLASASLRRHMIWMGAALMTAGLACMTLAFFISSFVLVIISQVMIGCAFGVNWANLSQALMNLAREEERNATSTLLPTAQSAGYAIGAALMGLIANQSGFAAAVNTEDVRSVLVTVLFWGALLSVPATFAATQFTRRLQSH